MRTDARRRTKWRLRIFATVAALAIEGSLVGLFFFSHQPPERAGEVVVQLALTRFPELRSPQDPPPDPRQRRTPDAPPPAAIRTPVPSPQPLPMAPAPLAGSGSSVASGSGPPGAGPGAPAPLRLNLGCMGRVYDYMSAEERRNCRTQYARTSGIPDFGGIEPTLPPTEAEAGFIAAGKMKDERNRPVYPSGNRTSMGCPEGNMTGCVDGIMNKVGGVAF